MRDFADIASKQVLRAFAWSKGHLPKEFLRENLKKAPIFGFILYEYKDGLANTVYDRITLKITAEAKYQNNL